MSEVSPRVFISYSHDGPEHEERVLDLADRLREDGIDAEVDQYVQGPAEGWPAWCERQIIAAAFVLMVCTETYHLRVEGGEEPGRGLGVVWEAQVIRQLIYDAGAVSQKFVPILFSDGLAQHIPLPVKHWTHYVADSDKAMMPSTAGLRSSPGQCDRRWDLVVGACRRVLHGAAAAGAAGPPGYRSLLGAAAIGQSSSTGNHRRSRSCKGWKPCGRGLAASSRYWW